MKRLLLLNGAAILAVILFHSSGWGFVAMFAWAQRFLPAGTSLDAQYGSAGYYGLRLIEQFVVFAIPAFLFVSGVFIALVANRRTGIMRWQLVEVRLRHLLIPYVLWTTILFAAGALSGPGGGWRRYVLDLLTGAADPAYYYVPLLCQFYLLAPLLVRLAHRRWRLLLLLTGLLQLGVQLLYYPALLGVDVGALNPYVDRIPKWFFAVRIFWFALGIVAGFHFDALLKRLVAYRWPLLTSAVLLFALGVVEWELMVRASGERWLGHRETLLDSLYGLLFIAAFLGHTSRRVPLSGALAELGGKSYGIYLIHSPVMQIAARTIYHVAPLILAQQILLQPILITAGLVVPLALMSVSSLQRSPVRRYYRYGFG